MTHDNVYYLFRPMARSAENCPNRIRAIRKAHGMSAERLGEQIGLSKSMVLHLELGRRPLTFEHGRAIARILGVALGDLLNPEDNPDAIPPEDRAFVQKMLALEPPARRAIDNLADNMVEWRGLQDDNGKDRHSA